jgi:hypothetical protein
LAAPAPGHELNVIRDHLVLAAFLAFRRFPTAPLQAPFNHGQIPFTEIFRCGFGLPTETDDIHEGDFFSLLFALSVTPVYGQAERGD